MKKQGPTTLKDDEPTAGEIDKFTIEKIEDKTPKEWLFESSDTGGEAAEDLAESTAMDAAEDVE